MKALRPISIALCLLLTSVAYTQQNTALDGYWWQQQNQLVKLVFIEGFVQGATESSDSWRAYADSEIPTEAKAKMTYKGTVQSTNFSNVTYGQLQFGLDEFYKNFRNTSIRARWALGYVRNQIKGVSQEELDFQLQLMRKSAATSRQD